jgi:hypothetical protein
MNFNRIRKATTSAFQMPLAYSLRNKKLISVSGLRNVWFLQCIFTTWFWWMLYSCLQECCIVVYKNAVFLSTTMLSRHIRLIALLICLEDWTSFDLHFQAIAGIVLQIRLLRLPSTSDPENIPPCPRPLKRNSSKSFAIYRRIHTCENV